ncbi:N-acetylneuraminate synthase family protein [Candidatus Accumulibacter contiguus]|jgi:N,N'-diacetyllegionaminate synthase|uniref:Spore coat polysaccharide biosynthesis protein SpsE n=2 Tax=Candidatus Accumulibacter TaxID=327159 RepID=A0A080LZ62_9PROT|nr:N-acetylneuraminate synthase family protein [Candidatus Accumulibacter contiguus]KFB74173.1 MAG: Spore coat polysaccharide biosynthesis protein SpsE [Candidatus Accumulibacter phosphatis]NMQ05971.1 N-acetylneuraminate synthase [Candidatus Accumulibacter contiguus]
MNDSLLAIAGRRIGPNEPPYCIAEVGINHNGDLGIAKRMIEIAKEVGADAVKFQTFKAEEFCGDPEQMFTYQSQGQTVTESMLEMFRRYEFAPQQWRAIKAHCDAVGITFFSTPQNRSDLDLLLAIGVLAIKVGSDDFTNLPLLRSYAAANLPLILSCGMSDLAEVHQALETVGWFTGKPLALLLCTSQYPTPAQDVNIRKLTTLQQAFPGLLVGFSDHTQGPLAAGLAVALGARVFEKHFTLDHDLPGPDHWFAEDTEGLREWIRIIKCAHEILGSPFLMPTKAERGMRLQARRSIVALRNIEIGEELNAENIGLRRPGAGLSPELIDQVMGLRVARQIKKGCYLRLTDISNQG